MDFKNDNNKNEDYLEILKNEESFVSDIDKKMIFITTDSWLAQLGPRKNN